MGLCALMSYLKPQCLFTLKIILIIDLREVIPTLKVKWVLIRRVNKRFGNDRNICHAKTTMRSTFTHLTPARIWGNWRGRSRTRPGAPGAERGTAAAPERSLHCPMVFSAWALASEMSASNHLPVKQTHTVIKKGTMLKTSLQDMKRNVLFRKSEVKTLSH